jgi:hypothetical protein
VCFHESYKDAQMYSGRNVSWPAKRKGELADERALCTHSDSGTGGRRQDVIPGIHNLFQFGTHSIVDNLFAAQQFVIYCHKI